MFLTGVASCYNSVWGTQTLSSDSKLSNIWFQGYMLTGIKIVEHKSSVGFFKPGNEHIVAVQTFSRTQSLGYKHMRKREIWFILCAQGKINKWSVSIAYKAHKGRKYKKKTK